MKRKLLCIAVAVIMILPLAFAAIPTASAAVAEGWLYNDDASRYKINADGSLSICYNSAGVSWANLGAGYDASAFNNNYTMTVEVFLPAYSTGTVTGATAATTPTSAISIKAAQVSPVDPGYNWVSNGVTLKFVDYQGRVGEDMYTAWGNTWKVVELFAQGAALADCVNPNFYTLGFEAGEWATYKAIVDGNKVTIYVNDVLVCAEYVDPTEAGNYIWLGTGGDDWNWDNAPSFRNFKIVSNDGSVADYEAYKYTYVEPKEVLNATNAPAWSQLTAFNADGFNLSNGTAYVTESGALTLSSPAGMYWPQTGLVCNEKITVDGAEFVINGKAFSNISPNGYGAITFSSGAATGFAVPGIFGMRSYGIVVPDFNKAVTFSVYGTNLNIWINGAGGDYDIGTAVGVDTDVTVKFVVEEGDIKFLVNGTKLTFEDEELGTVDISVPAEGIVDADGKAYLAISAVGYGSSGSEAFTVKTINGVAAAVYEGEATYTEHKASTPVVQWRAPEEGVAAGLRFKTEVALNKVNNNDSIEKMGTLIIPADKLGAADLVLSADGKANGITYLDIVAKNYYEKTDAAISFTAVLIGIPETALDRDFVAVSYIAYADGTVTYGAARTNSVNDAINA